MASYEFAFKDRNMTIINLASQIKKGKVSPYELVRDCLYRITKLNPILNSFISVFPEDLILTKAKQSEKLIRNFDYKGPLHGIPFSVKDLMHVRGLKFTAGSRYYSDCVSNTTAAVVNKLEKEGAILIGSNNLNELASGITGKNTLFGDSKNPNDLSRISGGSSGGSAVAVASGMVIFSIGTDTGGSVRVPSSLCGVVGMKPTFGTINMSGILPLASSLDHVGIITRNVTDSYIIYDRIKFQSGSKKQNKIQLFDHKPIYPSNLQILYPNNYFLDILDDEIKKTFFALLKLLKKNSLSLKKIHLNFTEEFFSSWKKVRLYEAARIHAVKIEKNSGQLSQDVRDMLLKGSKIRRSSYMDAKTNIEKIKKEFLSVLNNGLNILLIPTTVIFAPKLRSVEIDYHNKKLKVRDLLLRNTIVFNSIGFPALSIPMNRTVTPKSILPIGLQLIGAPYHDALTLTTGIAIENLINIA